MKPMPLSQPVRQGSVVWFTGLSAAGKTSLSREVARILSLRGEPCLVLDGDELRRTLSYDLGFSAADRLENVRRLSSIAQEHAANGSLVLVAAIAPYREQRERLRADSPVPFLEIFVDAPLTTCEERDPKGLYRKVRAGLLQHFTGVDDIYEAPEHPDLHCFTATETLEASVNRVVLYLEERLDLGPTPTNRPKPALQRVRALGSLAWSMRGARARAEAWTRLRFGQRHFQSTTHTRADRYPALFKHCQKSLAAIPVPCILSFGCSTGEEVASLAGYLPNAEIIGVDINQWCLRQGQRKQIPKTRFLQRFSPEFERMMNFDAIFCLAVFQRTEHRIENMNLITEGFTFAIFAAEIANLSSKLRPGGYLYLDNCDFRFEDTNSSHAYDPVPSPVTLLARNRPVFDHDNKLVANKHLAVRIFRKRLTA